jgi:hypothetical protein
VSDYDRVPKDREKNLAWRQKICRAAKTSVKLQRELLEACRNDTLFFLSAFTFVIDPRKGESARIDPFIPWPWQVPYIEAIEAGLRTSTDEPQELLVEKARGAGFTWCTLNTLLKHWVFDDYFLMGMTSKDEKTMDSPNPDSLGWKIDWQLAQLPSWMLSPKDFTRSKSDHTWVHVKKRNSIAGVAATGSAGAGGRTTVWFSDELARWERGPDRDFMDSTQHVTNFRIIGSSYYRRDGAFYDMVQDKSSDRKLFVFDWTHDTRWNRGLYKVEGDKVVVLDPENPLPEGYLETLPEINKRLLAKGFKLDGTVRSPWYNKQCLRSSATPQGIAQEIDRNPAGIEAAWFDVNMVKVLLSEMARPPFSRGRLAYDADTLAGRFLNHGEGELKLWCQLEREKDDWRPPRGDYALGADISQGVGASNSSAFVLNRVTGEQVAEFTTKWRNPAEFCRDCLAICKWFWDAQVGWETNGPGSLFTQGVVNFGYGNVLRQRKKEVWSEAHTEKLGWTSANGDKSSLLGGINGGGLWEAVVSRKVQIRSEECITELGEYIFIGGKLVHRKSKSTTNEGAKNEAHGDRVIGAGVAVHMMKDRPAPKPEAAKPEDFPIGSHGRRIKELEERRSKSLEKDEYSWS